MSHAVEVPVEERQRSPLGLLAVVSTIVVLGVLALGDARLLATVVSVGAGLSGAVLYAAISAEELTAD